MASKWVTTEAAAIVARGVFAKLDCNNEGELGQHIGFAFDEWQSNHIRCGTDTAERDEFRYSVRMAIHSLGFNW